LLLWLRKLLLALYDWVYRSFKLNVPIFDFNKVEGEWEINNYSLLIIILLGETAVVLSLEPYDVNVLSNSEIYDLLVIFILVCDYCYYCFCYISWIKIYAAYSFLILSNLFFSLLLVSLCYWMFSGEITSPLYEIELFWSIMG